MAEINQNASAGNDALAAVLESLLVDVTAIRAKLGGILSGSTVVDLAALTDGVGTTNTLTVTGAALGDFVLVSSSLDAAGIIVTGYVSAADTVAVRVQNETGATLDISSATLRARVLPQSTFAAPAALTTTT